jgi:hypothetical protein
MSRGRRRHTPGQIIHKLRDADAMLAAGKTIGEVCQDLELSGPTSHRWRNQYGGMKAEERAHAGGGSAAEATRRGEPVAEEAPGRGGTRQGRFARGPGASSPSC